MDTKTANLTWEEFLAAGGPDKRFEYIDGEVRFMSPSGGRHGRVIRQVSGAANDYELGHPEWMSIATEVAFTMASGDWLCPDWALVRRTRFGQEGVPSGPIAFPPDVVFEVLSPGDTRRATDRKRAIYQANGVLQLWIDPEERMTEVISPNRPLRYFSAGETVTIEELPGFRLDLFPKIESKS